MGIAEPLPLGSEVRRIALVGSPNAGKTTLFNALTGGSARVANYPGVTVERREGKLRGTQRELRLLRHRAFQRLDETEGRLFAKHSG